MKKLSKIILKNFHREREMIRSKKGTQKPWIMRYKYFSLEFAKKHTFAMNPSLDWRTHFNSYKDTEHALQQLNKELRSYGWVKQQYNDRESQLYNKITGEILPLKVQDNKVIIDLT